MFAVFRCEGPSMGRCPAPENLDRPRNPEVPDFESRSGRRDTRVRLVSLALSLLLHLSFLLAMVGVSLTAALAPPPVPVSEVRFWVAPPLPIAAVAPPESADFDWPSAVRPEESQRPEAPAPAVPDLLGMGVGLEVELSDPSWLDQLGAGGGLLGFSLRRGPVSELELLYFPADRRFEQAVMPLSSAYWFEVTDARRTARLAPVLDEARERLGAFQLPVRVFALFPGILERANAAVAGFTAELARSPAELDSILLRLEGDGSLKIHRAAWKSSPE